MYHELAVLHGKPSVLKVAKAGNTRWAGHVIRRLDNNNAIIVFDYDLACKRRQGAEKDEGTHLRTEYDVELLTWFYSNHNVIPIME